MEQEKIELELDIRECLKIILEEYAIMVILKEEQQGQIGNLLPLFDRVIRMERIVCNIIGIDGDTIIESFKKNKLIVEDTLGDLMENYYGVKKKD